MRKQCSGRSKVKILFTIHRKLFDFVSTRLLQTSKEEKSVQQEDSVILLKTEDEFFEPFYDDDGNAMDVEILDRGHRKCFGIIEKSEYISTGKSTMEELEEFMAFIQTL